MENGGHDNDELVQALARHAAAAREEERQRIVEWLRDKVEPCRQAAAQNFDDDEVQSEWLVRAQTYDFAAKQIEVAVHLPTIDGGRG